MAFSSSNKNSAKARAVSVLPTTVGPKNKKLPSGLFSSEMPALARRMAREMALIASCWPITRRLSVASMASSFLASSVIKRITGIPVQRETTRATSSSVTSSFKKGWDFSIFYFRHLFQISLALGNFGLVIQGVNFLPDAFYFINQFFFGVPLGGKLLHLFFYL